MRLHPVLTVPGRKGGHTRRFDPGNKPEEQRLDGSPGRGASDVARKPIEIDCEEVWRQIANYIDDEVDPALRAIMASHFKDCAHCSAILDGTRNVVKLVGDGKAFEIPLTASQRFYKKLSDHLAARSPRKRGR